MLAAGPSATLSGHPLFVTLFNSPARSFSPATADDHDIYGLEMLRTPSLRLRFFARRRGVWIRGAAAASGWFPSIVRGTVLEEAGILAERVALRIELGVGLPEE